MAKVSILLPVYNSITKAERSDLLQQMLHSIINQTHKDFELLIMDNQSIDNTVSICTAYAEKDERIHVYVDDKQRSAEEAVEKLLKIATGEFVTFLSDDDLINSHYLEVLLKEFKNRSSIGLAYTNGAYINVQNQIVQRLILNSDGVYNSNLHYENFYKAIHKRIVLPVLFGLFRKDVYESLLPNSPFDELRANMDNFFMAKFFLNRNNSAFVNADLFYYRQRDRSLHAERLPYMPQNPILIWVYYVRHQLYFNNAVWGVVDKTNQEGLNEPLKIATLDSCLNQCGNLLNWVFRDLATDAFEKTVLSEIYTQFKPVLDLRLPCLSNAENLKEHQNIMRLRCKIMQERVLGHIRSIVQETELIESTHSIVEKLKEDFIEQIHA